MLVKIPKQRELNSTPYIHLYHHEDHAHHHHHPGDEHDEHDEHYHSDSYYASES